MSRHTALLTAREKALYRADTRTHILQWPGVRHLFLVFAIVTDGFTLFSLMDLLLTQQAGLTWVITITVAACLNIAPMLLASCLRNPELDKTAKAVLCGALAALFAVLFLSTFTLRIASRSTLFTSSSQLTIVTTAEDAGEGAEPEEPTAAETVLAVILGLEPLATSICTFVLSYEVPAGRRRRHLLEQYRILLQEEIDRDRVMIQELEADMQFDLDAYDLEQYQAMQALLAAQGEQLEQRASRRLAEREGTPEAVAYLMEHGCDVDREPAPLELQPRITA